MSHETGPKPLFVQEAERRAQREGKTLDEVLDADRARLHVTPYPGRDCLEPDDLQSLLASSSSAARAEGLLSHVEGCDHCATLLMLSEPSPRPLDAVLREVRQRARPEAAAVPAPEEKGYTQVLLDVAGTVSPSLIVLGWIALARTGGPEALPLTLSFMMLLAVPVLLGLGALWISRLRAVRGSMLRYSLGAVAGGLSLAIVGVTLSSASAQQLSNAESAAFALAKDTAKEQVFDVLEARQATRRFPLVASPKRALVMHARAVSEGQATYVAAEKWFSGELVAEVRPESAELRLKDKEQDQLLSRFVVGRVTALEGGTLALNSAGRTYPLSLGGAPAPTEGSEVVAATDPAGKMVVAFRQLGSAAHPQN